MVTPLTIDPYTRDLWQEFDAAAIAQLAPLAYMDCYHPREYVGLDTTAQTIAALAAVEFTMHVTPGSLIYGLRMGSQYGSDPNWLIQCTSLDTGLKLWSDPISQALLANNKPGNFPYLFKTPIPVVGDGLFLVEVWNQRDTAQTVVPIFCVLEVQ